MKKLFIVIWVMILISCQRDSVPSDKGLPGDVELVNPYMDSITKVISLARKKPHPVKPGDPEPPPPPPPTEVKRGCVLLDFNGHQVNSDWGYFYCASAGNVDITSIVNRVRFDYAQFDIDIITDEAAYYTYPENKRVRIVVTTTNWYGNVGGVAYIRSWNWYAAEKDAFVFSQLLLFNAKYIADAISHEAGHTLGCYHHSDWVYNEDGSCFKRNEYLSSNHIMGNCYYYLGPILTIGVSSKGCYIEENDPQTITNSINL